MIVFGVAFIVLGIISTIYGINLNNSLEAQLSAFFKSGSTNPGTIWIIVGATAIVIGLILLAVGLRKRK